MSHLRLILITLLTLFVPLSAAMKIPGKAVRVGAPTADKKPTVKESTLELKQAVYSCSVSAVKQALAKGASPCDYLESPILADPTFILPTILSILHIAIQTRCGLFSELDDDTLGDDALLEKLRKTEAALAVIALLLKSAPSEQIKSNLNENIFGEKTINLRSCLQHEFVKTALWWPVFSGDYELCKLLIQAGANAAGSTSVRITQPSTQPVQHQPPLLAYAQSYQVADLLIRSGATIDEFNVKDFVARYKSNNHFITRLMRNRFKAYKEYIDDLEKLPQLIADLTLAGSLLA